MHVAELQRGRLLSATFALVEERGYEGVTARSVAERAGMLNRTFYECFSDREDCFLAAFNHAVDGLEFGLRGLGFAAWLDRAGPRGLAALLLALDREPAVRRLVFVEALAAGPRVLARRARVLESLAGVVDWVVRMRGAGAVPAVRRRGCCWCDVWCDPRTPVGTASGSVDRVVGFVDGDDRAAVQG